MKVHLYRVEQTAGTNPFSSVLRTLEPMALADRKKRVRGQDIRVEDISNRRHKWFIDIGRLRFDHGPGHARRDQPIEDFRLDRDAGFGEEVAALFDQDSGFIAIQYNHFGVRAGTLEDYFNEFANESSDEYKFEMTFDREVHRRLQDKTIFKTLTFGVVPQRVDEGDFAANTSLADAISIGRRAGANSVTVKLSMGQGGRGALSPTVVQRAITALQRKLSRDEDAVTKLEVRAKDDMESEAEVIDLIQPRLSTVIEGLEVGPGLRVSREDRYEALSRAMRGWARDIAQGGVA
jgi:hypothetical protein